MLCCIVNSNGECKVSACVINAKVPGLKFDEYKVSPAAVVALTPKNRHLCMACHFSRVISYRRLLKKDLTERQMYRMSPSSSTATESTIHHSVNDDVPPLPVYTKALTILTVCR
jgi:hypothetical protein